MNPKEHGLQIQTFILQPKYIAKKLQMKIGLFQLINEELKIYKYST